MSAQQQQQDEPINDIKISPQGEIISPGADHVSGEVDNAIDLKDNLPIPTFPLEQPQDGGQLEKRIAELNTKRQIANMEGRSADADAFTKQIEDISQSVSS